MRLKKRMVIIFVAYIMLCISMVNAETARERSLPFIGKWVSNPVKIHHLYQNDTNNEKKITLSIHADGSYQLIISDKTSEFLPGSTQGTYDEFCLDAACFFTIDKTYTANGWEYASDRLIIEITQIVDTSQDVIKIRIDSDDPDQWQQNFTLTKVQ